MEPDVTHRARADQARVAAGLQALQREAEKYGVILDDVAPENASYSLQVDPCSQETALCARWALPSRRGMMTVREDGFVYAEMDLAIPHPKRPGLWIEAVTAWGMPSQIKAEPRLLDMPA